MPFLLVISLDTEEGKKRRDNLNFHHIWIKASNGNDAPDWIKSKFKTRHNTLENHKLGKLGCLTSHYDALRYIIDNKLNDVIVCEDDAILKNPKK